MNTLPPALLMAGIGLLLVACGGGGDGGENNQGDNDQNDPYDADRQACVDAINDYRDSIGLPPYERWVAQESCADEQARQDSESGVPHGAFPQCAESAQNECPGWPSIDSTITGCLQMIWDEGPGQDFQQHGHYINMSSTSYTRVACGFYRTPAGEVWAVQNFR